MQFVKHSHFIRKSTILDVNAVLLNSQFHLEVVESNVCVALLNQQSFTAFP